MTYMTVKTIACKLIMHLNKEEKYNASFSIIDRGKWSQYYKELCYNDTDHMDKNNLKHNFSLRGRQNRNEKTLKSSKIN